MESARALGAMAYTLEFVCEAGAGLALADRVESSRAALCRLPEAGIPRSPNEDPGLGVGGYHQFQCLSRFRRLRMVQLGIACEAERGPRCG